MRNSPSFGSASGKFEANAKKIVLAAAMATGLTAAGCDGGGYDVEPGQHQPGNDAGTDSQYGGGNGTPECTKIPAEWDIRGYNGCEATTELAVAWKEGNGMTQSVASKEFINTDSTSGFYNETGKLVYLHEPSSQDCGPMSLSAVSNSGTFEYKVSAPVDFYDLKKPEVEIVSTQLHNGTAPTVKDLYGIDYGKLMMDLVDCATEPTCQLKTDNPGLMIPTGTVVYQGTGASAKANGAFCEVKLTVMKSHKQ